jgi:hypothetical protein
MTPEGTEALTMAGTSTKGAAILIASRWGPVSNLG